MARWEGAGIMVAGKNGGGAEIAEAIDGANRNDLGGVGVEAEILLFGGQNVGGPQTVGIGVL